MKTYRALALADALTELLECCLGDLDVDITTIMDVAGWGQKEKVLFLRLKLEAMRYEAAHPLEKEVCDA